MEKLPDVQAVLNALKQMRAPLAEVEYDLHLLVQNALQEAGLPFIHEAPLAPRCRIDFLSGSVGIEIKKDRPDPKRLKSQLLRYAKTGQLTALIALCERHVPLPDQIHGIPLYMLPLQSLWGIAAEPGYSALDDEPTGAMLGGSEEEISEELWEEAPPAPNVYEEFFAKHDYSSLPVPAYLEYTAPSPEDAQGVLRYNARSRCWMLHSTGMAAEMCRRIFPSAVTNKQGDLRLPSGQHTAEDLCWVSQRYPLLIEQKDRARWEGELADIRQKKRRQDFIKACPDLPDPPESMFSGTLMPFQKSGMTFLMMTGRCLLADEMGLGKTVQSLCALSALGAFPALIVPPSHLVLNWQSEILRFVKINGQLPIVHVIKGLTPYPLPKADIYICHYLLLRGWKDALQGDMFRAVLFDEAQELRHTGSEKYSAASLLSEKAPRVWGLSGTPIYNRGGEIWNVMNAIEYHILGDYDSFTRRWCVGYDKDVVSHPEELGEYLKSEGLLLRRTKAQVLPQLPEKRRLVQEIDGDDALYQRLMCPVWEKIYQYQAGQYETPSQKALLEDQIVSEERRACGVAKAPFVCRFVETLLENGEKVLLFAHHHDVMDIYKSELSRWQPCFITGRESASRKDWAVEAFQQGETRLCCISLRSASGLNLQSATAVVFGELDWSPAVHSQAEDRAHRIGQKDSLLCYYLVSPQGADSAIRDALGLKVSQFLSLMGDRPKSEQEAAQDANVARKHIEELIERLMGSPV